jgi:divalent metal cation (Fe/Co/Zn/Cd) transporter
MTADHRTREGDIGEHREKLLAALLSVGVNLSLIAVEAGVAWFTGSLAVLADAGHSTFDLLASIAAVWGVRMAATRSLRTSPA